MRIDLRDLTPDYLRCMPGRKWGTYESAYPALFRHYHRYWASPAAEYALREADVVREKTTLLTSRLPVLERRLTEAGFSDEVPVVLFVGKNTTNGHAFWDEQRGKFVVWLPVEAYATSRQVDVFVTHELIHALHYTRRPEFFFQNEHQRKLVGRQVVTEGIATFGSMRITGCDAVTALWADYVSPEFASRWYDQCRRREREILGRIRAAWETSSEKNEWFTMWDADDVTRYRGGYYAGLRLIQAIHTEHGLSLPELLALDARQLESRR